MKQLTTKGQREIIVCNMPATLIDKLRIPEDCIKLEVEDIDQRSAAELHETLNRETQSLTLSSIMNALTSSPLSSSNPYVYGYLVDHSDLVKIRDPGSAVYRISERALRHLKGLLFRRSLNDLYSRSKHPPETHQESLDFFLLAYARHNPPLAMVSAVLAILTTRKGANTKTCRRGLSRIFSGQWSWLVT